MIKYIAAFGIFGIITTEFGVIGILPELARYYHISIDKAGILLSAFALIIALCGPWVTLFASGFDRKKLMLLTLAVFVLSNTLSSFLVTAISVTMLLAAMFSMYGYFADYMEKVYGLNGAQVSTMLMLFGGTGVLGNWVAGRLLSKSVVMTLQGCLLALAIIYVLLHIVTGFSSLAILLIAVWGFVHTACFVVSQSWIMSAAPGAEDFANSLGVSFGNLGLTLGAVISGWVIAHVGVQHTHWASLGLVVIAWILVNVRISRYANMPMYQG